jgi:hypothetical protein
LAFHPPLHCPRTTNVDRPLRLRLDVGVRVRAKPVVVSCEPSIVVLPVTGGLRTTIVVIELLVK